MISSTSCSSRALAAALAVAGLACAGGRGAVRGAPAVAPGRRVAVLPVENVSGGAAPLERLRADVEGAVRRAGLEVVAGPEVEAFLARHRLRHTGGVDREAARAARDELRVDAIVVTSVTQYAAGAIPKVSLHMRLVAVAGEPTIAWIDGAGRAGDESPGLFGLGVTTSVDEVAREVFASLSRSLAAFLRGEGPPAPTCDGGHAFRPKSAFRAPGLGGPGPYAVAVLPFLDETARRTSSTAVTLEFVRHLVANPRFRVLEPGVVRGEVIRFRVVQEDGVSLEHARLLADVLDVDLVVAGQVREHDDFVGSGRPPAVSFGAQVLERSERRVLWESASRNRGDDAASLFGTRRVKSASALTCRMVKNVVAEMLRGERRAERRGSAPAPRAVDARPAPGPAAEDDAQQGPSTPGPAQPLRADPATIERTRLFP